MQMTRYVIPHCVLLITFCSYLTVPLNYSSQINQLKHDIVKKNALLQVYYQDYESAEDELELGWVDLFPCVSSLSHPSDCGCLYRWHSPAYRDSPDSAKLKGAHHHLEALEKKLSFLEQENLELKSEVSIISEISLLCN